MQIQWPLVAFMTFFCTTAGLTCCLGVVILTGKGSRKLRIVLAAAAAAFAVITFAASFFYLHHWERVFSSFAHLGSGIARELVGIVVALVALIVALVQFRGAEEDEKPPVWLGIVLAVLGAAMAITAASSYVVPKFPAGLDAASIAYCLAVTALIGTAGTWAIAEIFSASGLAKNMSLATAISGLAVAVIVIVFYNVACNTEFASMQTYFDPTRPTVKPLLGTDAFGRVLDTIGAPLFWGLAFAGGGLVPAALGFLRAFVLGKQQHALTVEKTGQKQGILMAIAPVALVCALAGAMCFRAAYQLFGTTVFGVF